MSVIIEAEGFADAAISISDIDTVDALEAALCGAWGVPNVVLERGGAVLDSGVALAEAGIVGADERLQARVSGETVAMRRLQAKGYAVAGERSIATTVAACLESGDHDGLQCCVETGLLRPRGVEEVLRDAVKASNYEAVRALCAVGADADSMPYMGCSPLHFAARQGDVAMLEVLVDLGASVSPQGYSGWTPLMSAVDAGQLDAVTWLLARDADVAATSRVGSTCLDVAQSPLCADRKDEIEALLVHHGAVQGPGRDAPRALPERTAARPPPAGADDGTSGSSLSAALAPLTRRRCEVM